MDPSNTEDQLQQMAKYFPHSGEFRYAINLLLSCPTHGEVYESRKEIDAPVWCFTGVQNARIGEMEIKKTTEKSFSTLLSLFFV